MRIYLFYMIAIIFSVYAYYNWYRSLCFVILFMGVIEYRYMPKSIMDIQGLNLWNLMFVNVVISWVLHRRKEGLVWDMPRHIVVMLLIYLGVILVGFFRAVGDLHFLPDVTVEYMITERLINAVKWVLPSLLLFDGCRNQERLVLGTIAILGIYFLLTIQVIRLMPPSSALAGDEFEHRSRRLIQNEMGYNRVNLSMILSGGSWAVFAMLPLMRKRSHFLALMLVFLVFAYGQALSGGRMGYVTWGFIGFYLCVFRWRKFLLMIPVMIIVVALMFPGVVERMTEGFGETTVRGQKEIDDYSVTAGRTLIWPHVIEKIQESPIVGYGRLAMNRTGLTMFLRQQYREEFAHPHNAYFEWLMDNGIIGFILVMPFYGLMLYYAMSLFLDRSNPWYGAIGGMTVALLLALLVAGMGSQTFYPREGAVGMWCGIGLTMRMILQRRQNQAAIAPMPIPSVSTLPTSVRFAEQAEWHEKLQPI